MTATDDRVIRLAVLGAIAAGRSFAYAARTCGATPTRVQAIAAAAGHPDRGAVWKAWEELREATAKPGPKKPAPRLQLRARPTGRPKPADVIIGGPVLSDERTRPPEET